MKKLFIVANWKSNKTESESISWIQEFQISNFPAERDPASQDKYPISNKEVVVCPSFVHLPILKSYIINHKSNIVLGVQDISPFDTGAYTGSVNAGQASEFARYAIIGHSERRTLFNEDDAVLTQKVTMAKKHGLTPIFCVQNENTSIPPDIAIVAYEPPSAIGTGFPDTPENADAIAKIIKEKHGIQYVLYGASVTSGNVKSFTQMPNIDGVLVGGASLDPLEFSKIIDFS